MSAPKKTFYEILGLKTDCTVAEIKRSYRKLVKTQHPDLDHTNKSDSERQTSTEEMLLLNQAYETLMDKKLRAQYDVEIGVTVMITPQFKFEKDNEDEARAFFLAKVFNPQRQAISRVINRYKKQLQELAADPYDDDLMEDFSAYLDDLEATLRKASQSFTAAATPRTLESAVLMMRHCIAQGADALEELRSYCLNYNYSHLTMAEHHFQIAMDRAKEAVSLTRH